MKQFLRIISQFLLLSMIFPVHLAAGPASFFSEAEEPDIPSPSGWKTDFAVEKAHDFPYQMLQNSSQKGKKRLKLARLRSILPPGVYRITNDCPLKLQQKSGGWSPRSPVRLTFQCLGPELSRDIHVDLFAENLGEPSVLQRGAGKTLYYSGWLELIGIHPNEGGFFFQWNWHKIYMVSVVGDDAEIPISAEEAQSDLKQDTPETLEETMQEEPDGSAPDQEESDLRTEVQEQEFPDEESPLLPDKGSVYHKESELSDVPEETIPREQLKEPTNQTEEGQSQETQEEPSQKASSTEEETPEGQATPEENEIAPVQEQNPAPEDGNDSKLEETPENQPIDDVGPTIEEKSPDKNPSSSPGGTEDSGGLVVASGLS